MQVIRNSYLAKLITWILPVSVCGLLTLSLSSYFYIRKQTETLIIDAMTRSTQKSAEIVNQWLTTLLLEPEAIAETPEAKGINRSFEAIDQLNIDRYKALHGRYGSIFLDVYAADQNGAYHTVQPDGARFTFFKGSIADRPYFKSIMRGSPALITPPLVSRTTGVPTIFVVAPIKDDAGRPQGLIGVGVSLDYVKKVAQNLTVGRSGSGFVLARDGTFITPS